MKKVSFEEIGALTATFLCGEGVEAGMAVRVSGEGAVALCGAGTRPCGVALSVAGDGCAGVQVGGAVTLGYSGADLTPGWRELTGDGTGKVKLAAAGDEKGAYLVLSVDAVGKTAVVLL